MLITKRGGAGAIPASAFSTAGIMFAYWSSIRNTPSAPAEARRPETYQPFKLLGDPHLTTLVIDHQLLAKLPASMLIPPAPKTDDQKKPADAATAGGSSPKTEAPAPPPSSAQDQQAVKQLEALKQEMEQLRRQMQQQQEEMEKLKEQKPKKKKPEGTP